MPQLLANRAVVRAAQFVIAAAGILFLLLIFSRQAHAAAQDEHAGLNSATTSATSPVTGAASAEAAGTAAAGSPLTSAVGSVASAANPVVGSADQGVEEAGGAGRHAA